VQQCDATECSAVRHDAREKGESSLWIVSLPYTSVPGPTRTGKAPSLTFIVHVKHKLFQGQGHVRDAAKGKHRPHGFREIHAAVSVRVKHGQQAKEEWRSLDALQS
jgi:hypothetical protein